MKQTAGSGKRSGFDFGGDRVTHWIRIGNERYPLTQAQWERRQARLVASGAKSSGD